jgi:L-lysine exporter family protein LysE/ArgO
MLSSLFQGFLLSLSLILAIGAQNAFVLKQGLKGQHVFWVCVICALSDALLISLGVFGLSAVEAIIPEFAIVARYFGAAFLFFYGSKSFLSAYKQRNSLEPEGARTTSLSSAVLVCLALTWLNPHVYLDTVVLLGSISLQYGEQSHLFGIGAIAGSFVFFFSLGYGASFLRPLFAKPITWVVLEVVIGLVMWTIALSLLLN